MLVALSQLTAGAFATWALRTKRRGNWLSAAQGYRCALACRPTSHLLWVQYGNALKECGDLAAAETAYRTALILAPDHADGYLQLGHALKLQGRGDDAQAAYQSAISIDPLLYEASLELLSYGRRAHVAAPTMSAQLAEPNSTQRRLLVFDASDLLNHIPYRRSISGIQRVQIGIIASLLESPDGGSELAIAWFDQDCGYWKGVPDDLFLRLVALIERSRPGDERTWRECVKELIAFQVHGPPIRFRDGAVLVNLGTSWALSNYFLRIATVKARYRLYYLPFVHDCIPALFPEFCAADTVRDFGAWMSGVFDHADGFLTNSRTTAGDLGRLAAQLGREMPPTAVIALDARPSSRFPSPEQPARILKRHDLERRPYVLFVSSLEPRKNHVAAFRAWLDLIERRGRRNTPLLICVGSRSWMVDEAMQLLRSHRALRSRVLIVSDVTDAELAALYRHCLFTIYPSFYEGWGLPVIEALCYGRVPLIAAVPALRESGGDVADYFAPGDVRSFIAALERLIDDVVYRSGREVAIAKRFQPRTWRDLAQDILDHVGLLCEASSSDDGRSGTRSM